METWKPVAAVPILLPKTLHLWHLQLDATNFIQPAYNACSPEEHARANTLKQLPARIRFLQIRSWLRQIMGGYLEIEPKKLQFGYSHYGKPFIQWPQSAPYFNLSHSDSLCLLAVCWNAPIGIDIEFIRPRMGIKNIAQRCFNASIVNELNSLSGNMQLHRFYSYWTLFEAKLKAQGGSVFDAELDNACQIEAINFIPSLGFQGCVAVVGKMAHKNTWQKLKLVI